MTWKSGACVRGAKTSVAVDVAAAVCYRIAQRL